MNSVVGHERTCTEPLWRLIGARNARVADATAGVGVKRDELSDFDRDLCCRLVRLADYDPRHQRRLDRPVVSPDCLADAAGQSRAGFAGSTRDFGLIAG